MSWYERGVRIEKCSPKTATEYAQVAVISVATLALLAIIASYVG